MLIRFFGLKLEEAFSWKKFASPWTFIWLTITDAKTAFTMGVASKKRPPCCGRPSRVKTASNTKPTTKQFKVMNERLLRWPGRSDRTGPDLSRRLPLFLTTARHTKKMQLENQTRQVKTKHDENSKVSVRTSRGDNPPGSHRKDLVL